MSAAKPFRPPSKADEATAPATKHTTKPTPTHILLPVYCRTTAVIPWLTIGARYDDIVIARRIAGQGWRNHSGFAGRVAMWARRQNGRTNGKIATRRRLKSAKLRRSPAMACGQQWAGPVLSGRTIRTRSVPGICDHLGRRLGPARPRGPPASPPNVRLDDPRRADGVSPAVQGPTPDYFASADKQFHGIKTCGWKVLPSLIAKLRAMAIAGPRPRARMGTGPTRGSFARIHDPEGQCDRIVGSPPGGRVSWAGRVYPPKAPLP